ncbi:succinate dehydrogenase cytochrome b560 subunit, mitochondrial [Eucyclogobius newberryi]|uniref:succinate dehydrogenase cytochrome b560 subunit, mitochondrial n=1 Tax=Eucyclogobius newberryi TaxID=166745 RepID=UPI003B5D0125
MALLLRSLAGRGMCLSRAPSLQTGPLLCRHVAPMGTTAKEEMNKFWAKNNRLNRPISPHLTIYKWSVPMLMSVTHRGTGVGLSGAISAFALAALVLPGTYPYYLDLIHSLWVGPALIGLAKIGIAFPASFHTYNGVRHLWWDIGKGFRIPEVYRTGYTVIGLSVLTSFAVAFLL